MPTLDKIAADAGARDASIERMCRPDPVRDEVALNSGIRNFTELAAVVCAEPTSETDDDLAELAKAAEKMCRDGK